MPAGGVLHATAAACFVANLNLASDTAYSPPDKCPELDGATTVQQALDRLAGLLQRLYHVSGDGLEGPVGEKIELRAGVANRCGIGDPQVRCEALRDDTPRRARAWRALDTVAPDAEGIAGLAYEITDEQRQFLRARLLADGSKPVGQPVYFTVSVAETGDPSARVVPAARLGAFDTRQPTESLARTLVQFRDAADFDTDGLFDPGGDRTALTATRPGTYIATGEIAWDQTSGNGYRSAEIMLRGDPVGHLGGPPLPRGVHTMQQVTAIVRMDAGDRVQLGATQSSGDRLLISSATLALAWLGP